MDLKYRLTLPDLMDLKEYIDCNTALKSASHADQEAESKANSSRR